MQIARRIEEVRAEKVLAKFAGEPFGDGGQRNAAGVGGEDALRRAQARDLARKVALDLQIFCDGFDDPVAVRDVFQVVFEVAGSDECSGSGVKKAAGFCLAAFPIRPAQRRCDWADLGRTISSNKAGMPALAKWAAMRDPMVPAPSTATRSIGFTRGVYREPGSVRNRPAYCYSSEATVTVSPESVPETLAWIGLPALRSFVQLALLLSISAARMLPTESNFITWPPAS